MAIVDVHNFYWLAYHERRALLALHLVSLNVASKDPHSKVGRDSRRLRFLFKQAVVSKLFEVFANCSL
jgi:hypothetical protein